jgi:hypothetical protein
VVERESKGAIIVTVLPITQAPPADPSSAVEILCPVKRHLGWTTIGHGLS